MPTIAYFITPHGFGHASRATAVMQALQRIEPDIQFLVFTTVPQWFFADQGINHLEYIPCKHDVGLVQHNPFEEDLPATIEQLDAIYPYSSSLMNDAVSHLKQAKADLVICDISPLGLVAARQCGIPSLLIENFTWDWIYQPFVSEYPQFQEFIDYLQQLYPLAEYHVQAEPICDRNPVLPKLEQLISRSFVTPPAVIRKQLGINENEKMVLVSFGGNRDQTNFYHTFQKYNEAVFVIGGNSEQVQRTHNVISLPHNSGFYHPDLVRGADIILGKAGYSTLAEVALAGKPFAFISREKNIESAVLADYIHSHLPALEISQSEYLSGRWIEKLPDILKLAPSSQPTRNGADMIADYIQTIIL